MRKVMIFGVFDGLHDGHRHMLKQAKSLGDHLIVVVAQNHIVKQLKGHEPQIDLGERVKHLEMEDGIDQVLVGDEDQGTWEIIKIHKPNVIALGYDQRELKANLESRLEAFSPKPEIIVLDAYRPDELHSSILNN